MLFFFLFDDELAATPTADRLQEIIFHHEWYPLQRPWRDAVKRWLTEGYRCEQASYGEILITGEGGQAIRVIQTMYGIRFCAPDDSRIAEFNYKTPDVDVIAALDGMLSPLSEQTRVATQEWEAVRRRGAFHWVDGARPIAVKLVSGKVRVRGFSFEEAVVDTLANSISRVCTGYGQISMKLLTLFASDCKDEILNQYGGYLLKNDDCGEIDRIFAALTKRG